MPHDRFIAVTYPDLYRAMRELVTDALVIVRSKVGDPPRWPEAEFYEVTVPSTGGVNTNVVARPNYLESVREAWSELENRPSYSAALHELGELRQAGQAVGHFGSDLARGFAFPILTEYLSAGAALSFEEETFAKYYGTVESFISSSHVTVRAFLDLFGVTCELSSPCILDSNHRLITLDAETIIRLLGQAYHTKSPITPSSAFMLAHAFGRLFLHPGQSVLEITFRQPKDRLGELSLDLARETQSASTALRLSHPGTGSLRFIDYEYLGFVPEFGHLGMGQQPAPVRFGYVVNSESAKDISKRWSQCFFIAQQIASTPATVSTHLRIAIERLNSSFERTIPTDRLLDYIIALEALCSQETDAVSYRVALRVATLIGRDATERQNIFDTIADAYRERSKLAHGKSSRLTQGDIETAREYLLKVEEHLLRTIHFFIRAEMTPQRKRDEILKIVDTTIVTQDRRSLEGTLSSGY